MIITLGSVGLPGTSGFISEILVLLGCGKSPLVTILAGTSLVLGAVYMLDFTEKLLLETL